MSDEQVTPKTIDDIIAGLTGFGLEELEEPLQVTVGKRTVSLRLSNGSSEDEMMSMLAAEEYRGIAWMQRVKCEILSRSISWLEGISIKNLPEVDQYVIHPLKPGEQVHIQVALRDLLMKWGMEVTNVLWKILMVHVQGIEDKLYASFPEARIMTAIEQRIAAQVIKDTEAIDRELIEDTTEKVFQDEGV